MAARRLYALCHTRAVSHVRRAIINARVPAVVYGAKEPNFGSCGSVLNLFEERYGHHPAIYGGVLSDDCAAALRAFFGGLRG